MFVGRTGSINLRKRNYLSLVILDDTNGFDTAGGEFIVLIGGDDSFAIYLYKHLCNMLYVETGILELPLIEFCSV